MDLSQWLLSPWLKINPLILPAKECDFSFCEQYEGLNFQMSLKDWQTIISSEQWKKISLHEDKTFDVSVNSSHWQISYLITWLMVPAWTQMLLELPKNSEFVHYSVYIDNDKIKQNVSINNENKNKYTIDLSIGRHLLIIKLIVSQHYNEDKVEFPLKVSSSPMVDINSFNSLPIPWTFKDISLLEDIRQIKHSPSGVYLAVEYLAWDPKEDKKASGIRIYDTRSKEIIYSIEGQSNILWINNDIFFTVSAEKNPIVTKTSLKTKQQFPMLFPKALGDLQAIISWEIQNGSQNIIINASFQVEKDNIPEPDIEIMKSPLQRLPEWDKVSQIFIWNYETGGIIPLTSLSEPNECKISLDGKLLAILDFKAQNTRPYIRKNLLIYDLSTYTLLIQEEFTFGSFSDLCFSPDGKFLAFAASKYQISEKNPEPLHNDGYEFIYLYEIGTKKMTQLDIPVIGSVGSNLYTFLGNGYYGTTFIWKDNNSILTLITHEGQVGLYDIELRITANIQLLSATKYAFLNPVVDLFTYCSQNKTVWVASRSLQSNFDIEYMKLEEKVPSSAIFAEPNRHIKELFQLAKTNPFTVQSSRGYSLRGWVYYPPNYDEMTAKSIPVIVFYYGGTVSLGESFAYQFHAHCMEGYLVYSICTSGGLDSSLEIANKHVNDWGTISAKDVIESIQGFLKVHPKANPKKVGAFGRSFGGFLSQTLAQYDDVFATLCSWAGISSISSYWGEGRWGFLYGSKALARTYPWSNKEIYIDKSPLFYADKIKVPLLLMHGISDVNVPVGESEQMYTALYILGKDSAYVRVRGEDHHTAKYSNTVIVDIIRSDWFAKYLKNIPDGWEHRMKMPH